ncbi:hypothetical protein [Paenibacillus koleovorans]|uniref:hypothetical protein n=1 Tax=Paenibacillus koleovorans TaxID=121608 RepID=UPI000FDA81CF|nr:hypothetical protein [Paenibacillus koleovorans]
MTDDPNDPFVFRGLTCYPDPGDPNTFYYRPSRPTPERDAIGRPVLILWQGGAGSRIQFGTQWTAENVELQALTEEIIRRYPDRRLTERRVLLSPEQVEIAGVALEIRSDGNDGSGSGSGNGSGNGSDSGLAGSCADASFTTLHKVRSSGYPPYSALFNVALTPMQAAHAKRALAGEPGYLRVTYSGTVRQPDTGFASLTATADISTWFLRGEGAGHVRLL